MTEAHQRQHQGRAGPEDFAVHCFLTTSFSESEHAALTVGTLRRAALFVACFISFVVKLLLQLIRHQTYQRSNTCQDTAVDFYKALGRKEHHLLSPALKSVIKKALFLKHSSSLL